MNAQNTSLIAYVHLLAKTRPSFARVEMTRGMSVERSRNPAIETGRDLLAAYTPPAWWLSNRG